MNRDPADTSGEGADASAPPRQRPHDLPEEVRRPAPGGDAGTVTGVGALLSGDAQVSPDERVARVAELFFERPPLEAVALVEGSRPVGLLTRNRLLLKLARSFGRELYARKPVTRIADLAPLVVRADDPIPSALERVLARSPAALYDEMIVVDEDGAFRGYASVRDLVEHQASALQRSDHARDTALARARDLERLDRLRTRFLAHATHELRSPVNAIVALAELLRIASERERLDQVQAKIPMLVRIATTLRGTVNNILDLSKLEAGRTDVSFVPVDVAALADDVASTTRLLVAEKPVDVRVEAPSGMMVETDGQKLRQILVNLASNAAKFTDRGAIVIRAAPEGDTSAVVEVADTGCGIDDEDLTRLFVPFGQLEDALTKSHQGTGLGLVIARSLATLLGGRVAVSSRRGHGSTFSLHLPRIRPASAPT